MLVLLMKNPSIIRAIAKKIDRWNWIILILSSPFYLFPGSWKNLALLIIPLLWLNALIAGKNPLPNTPLNLSILILAMMVLVSLYATYDIGVSLPKIAGMVLGLGVFYALVSSLKEKKGIGIGLAFFLATGLGVAGIGLLGTNWFTKFSFLTPILTHLPLVVKGLPGAESGFQPNEVAGGLLWLLPLLLVLTVLVLLKLKLLAAVLGWGPYLLVVLILLVFTGITAGEFILTQSRGGLIALAGSLPLLLILVFPPKKRWIYITSLVILGIILGLAAWQLGWIQNFYDANTSGGNSALSLDTLKVRVEIWSRAISGIQDFPMTGMGMNTFRKVVNVLYPMFSIGPNVDIGHAHNEFLQVALDLGLPGLVSFLAINMLALWMLVKTWMGTWVSPSTANSDNLAGIMESGPIVRFLVLGLGGGLLAHGIFGMTDAVALGAKPGVLFWMLLGLIACLFLQQRRIQVEND